MVLMRGASWLVIPLLLAGCGGSGGGSGGGASTAAGVTSAAPTPLGSGSTAAGTTSAATTTPPAATRVALTPRGLSVHGRTKLLYGGEVQYFRIKDPTGDVAKTHQMWADALDKVVAAGMNLVTTYVPWDVHEPRDGVFDFAGLNDLPKFLEMCHARGLQVIFKPGPFINSEWPYGIGSFGAIPEWFKAKFPGSLARKPDGSPFTVDLIGRAHGRQPSLFAPELLQYTERYFARLVPIIDEFVRVKSTIIGLQVDNETNFYFGDRYASDYGPHGLAQFRGFLRTKYATVAALNAAWGTSYASFDQAEPPRRRPDRGAPVRENLRHQDWFDAGHAGIEAFHLALRRMWERLGVREPDVLLCTNDSPHTFIGRDLSQWRGATKNTGGVAMLDAYPKQLPTSGGKPFDLPFLTSFFSKRFAASNASYAFAGGPPVGPGKCYGAELEGGLFSIPILNLALPVPVQTTDAILLQHIGRGSALAAVYVLHAGRNRDGTPYFTNAAIAIDGRPQPRYDALKRWGDVVTKHGDELLASDEVESQVAIVVDERFDAPAGGVAGHPAKTQVDTSCGLFGLLEDAGLNPAVVDLSTARAGALDAYKLVFFANPDVVHEDSAALLDAWVRRGGLLVNVGHRGRHDQAWRPGQRTGALLAGGLFSDATDAGVFENNLVAHGNMNLRVPAGPAGALGVGPFMAKYSLGPNATPLAWDRTFPFGQDGDVVAWTAARGAGTVVHLGGSPGWRWDDSRWYDSPEDELLRARALARWAAARVNVRPVASVKDAQGTCWARRVPGGATFLFVQSRLDRAATLTVELHDPAALGLSPTTRYALEDAKAGTTLATGRTGDDLARLGIAVPLDVYGTAVVRIR